MEERAIRGLVEKAFSKLLGEGAKVPDAAIEDAVRETRATGAPTTDGKNVVYNADAALRQIVIRALQKVYPANRH